jgi:glycine/D-amino acid oxidase-like deaminating enzyme
MINMAAQQYGASFPGIRMPGNNLWPLKTVALLYKLAKEQSSNFSLNLLTQTPVTSISRVCAAPRRWSVETPRGKISCSYVLHATNAYASHLLPHLYGPNGIIPTRGQVLAMRAAAPPDVITKCAWSSNEGFEYWFPRPMKDGEGTPLVILGGARETVNPRYELYEVDDSVCNEDVGRALRKFLPCVFPGKFEKDREPEIEWVGFDQPVNGSIY